MARELLDRVHGFGGAMGIVFAELLDLDSPARAEVVSWCGRFNLGISLVDYICDESGRGDALARLPPFDELAVTGAMGPLTNGGSEGATPMSPVLVDVRPEEAVACDLAQELVIELGRRARRWPRWRAVLADMYKTEVSATVATVGCETDVAARRRALRSTAAGPFGVMAARAALATSDVEVEGAWRLGLAVGDVMWAVDDAADLWDDLMRGSGNLFLLAVAAEAPSLLDAPASPFRDAAITRHLHATGVAERESAAAVRQLCTALDVLDVPRERLERSMGVVAAAAALW